MTKGDFRLLFLQALDRAAGLAEARLKRRIPRPILIDLHGGGATTGYLDLSDAVDRMFLGPDRFFRVIDVAITDVFPGRSVAFVRLSGHQPDDFGGTWAPADLGPFKQVTAERIMEHIELPGNQAPRANEAESRDGHTAGRRAS